MTFGRYLRTVRESVRTQDGAFSVRKVAQRIGVEPSYLSKIERDQVPPPSEAAIRRLAEELREDPDVLLAMAGKVSGDLQSIILDRPQLFARLAATTAGCTGPGNSEGSSGDSRWRLVGVRCRTASKTEEAGQ